MNELALKRAIKERDEFLDSHPELLDFQMDLLTEFEAFGNDPVANCHILVHKIHWNAIRIQKELTKLENDAIMAVSKLSTKH